MFDSLSNKLQDTLQKIRGQDKISELNIDGTLAEIRRQFLEADVSLKAVKLFTSRVKEQALDEKVLRGVKPGEQFVKIIYEALVERLGGENVDADKQKKVPVAEILGLSEKESKLQSILLLGLQGAGKTTAAAKLAYKLKLEGYKPLLVPCDLQRPAAVKQLKILAEQAGVDFVDVIGNDQGYLVASPLELSKLAKEQAEKNSNNIVIFDTAGRLQVDTDLMAELLILEKQVNPAEKLLVIDSLIGQEAANVADTFNTQIGITGVILSKLDADSRGGAALSVVEATAKPIKLASTGEKLEDLEIFYPERIASRILGMGDILSLVERAETQIAEEESKRLEAELMKGNFNYETFLSFQNMIAKLGDFGSIFKMMGMGGMLSQFGIQAADQGALLDQSQVKMRKFKIAINSMTKQERQKPELLSTHISAKSRKARIVKGSGLETADLDKLSSEFTKMSKMFKQIGPMLNMMGSGNEAQSTSPTMNPMNLMKQMAGGMSSKQQKAMRQAGMIPGAPKAVVVKIKKGTKPAIKGFRD